MKNYTGGEITGIVIFVILIVTFIAALALLMAIQFPSGINTTAKNNLAKRWPSRYGFIEWKQTGNDTDGMFSGVMSDKWVNTMAGVTTGLFLSVVGAVVLVTVTGGSFWTEAENQMAKEKQIRRALGTQLD